MYAFEYDGLSLKLLSTGSALPEWYNEVSYAVAIRIWDGEVFVSNRGHDSISALIFKDGRLELRRTVSSYGEWPRDFIVSGGYFISANEHGNSVAVISVSVELVLKKKLTRPYACYRYRKRAGIQDF